jgi:serine/threonine protein kinase
MVNAVVGDFGILRVDSGLASTHKTGIVGTIGFRAPEIMVSKETSPPYSTKSDVFSFGMILWCLANKTTSIFPGMRESLIEE